MWYKHLSSRRMFHRLEVFLDLILPHYRLTYNWLMYLIYSLPTCGTPNPNYKWSSVTQPEKCNIYIFIFWPIRRHYGVYLRRTHFTFTRSSLEPWDVQLILTTVVQIVLPLGVPSDQNFCTVNVRDSSLYIILVYVYQCIVWHNRQTKYIYISFLFFVYSVKETSNNITFCFVIYEFFNCVFTVIRLLCYLPTAHPLGTETWFDMIPP